MASFFVATVLLAGCGSGYRTRVPGWAYGDCGTFSESNGVFSYDAPDIETAAVRHEVRFDGWEVRTRLPVGWLSFASDDAAWFYYGDMRSRFIVRRPGGHHSERMRREHRSYRNFRGWSAGPLRTASSPRQPHFFRFINRTADSRGLMYSLLTETDDSDSGILVFGIWPADKDCMLLPTVMRAINRIRITRTA